MLNSAYKPLPGRFLVSEPFMHDQNFQRTVVLLVEHNEEGSLGFVLNRRLKVGLSELIEDMPDTAAPVFWGGPVEKYTLHFVHRIPDLPGARHVTGETYWNGNFTVLKDMIADGVVPAEDLTFFVGYSGWGEGQLTGELDRKSWIVAPENEQLIFGEDTSDLWRATLRGMGLKYQIISNYPVDPSLN